MQTIIIYVLTQALLISCGWIVIFASSTPVGDAIGTSLVATGMSGVVMGVYIAVMQKQTAALIAAMDLGLLKVFANRGHMNRAEYDNYLNRVADEICICGFGLSTLLQDYEADFPRWKASAKVRILLIDPLYPSDANHLSFANIRDVEEGKAVGTTANDVWTFVKRVRLLKDARFEIRLYRSLPTLNVFRVDDVMFFGPYLNGQQSRNTPTFCARSGTVLFKACEQHFEATWDKSIDPYASLDHAPFLQ